MGWSYVTAHVRVIWGYFFPAHVRGGSFSTAGIPAAQKRDRRTVVHFTDPIV